MWVILLNNADWDCFKTLTFAGDLEDSKSTSGGTLFVFGSQTFVPISWMCKKQTSVSHSSTESEIISLDAGLRSDGLLALELWDLIVSVLGNMTQTAERTVRPVIIDRSQRSQGEINALAGHAKKCVERHCELANKTTQQLYKVCTPCIDDHHFKEKK